MKLGAYDYILKPFDVPKLKQLVQSALQASHAMKQVIAFDSGPESEEPGIGIIGRSEPMQQVFKLIGQLAASDATALITGESGTGKELVARAIYHHSQRATKPFLAINCAAIPENLLESELFGHERGAFTGATNQRIGRFEQCHHGTLFLDEIGDMPLATQAKILRVLQSGMFERVGGNTSITVDVRIIAATNKPLEQVVAAKQFREDLFYRLHVVRIELPPLRERSEDIPLLVRYFLQTIGREQKQPLKSIAGDALKSLTDYRWPGNVRELENVIRRALVVTKGPAILSGDLPGEIFARPSNSSTHPVVTAPPGQVLPGPGASTQPSSDFPLLASALFSLARRDSNLKVLPLIERELIICALKETQGNQVQAAKLLGITRATLRKRIEKFHITREIAVH